MSTTTSRPRLSPEQIKQLNETLIDRLQSRDEGQVKEAESKIEESIKLRMYEDCFTDQVISSQPCPNERLTRQVGTDKPMIVLDRDIDTPAAVAVPFDKTPETYYMYGSRWEMVFDRIQSKRYTIDTVRLRTYIMDLRQLISDITLKKIHEVVDGKLIGAVRALLIGQNQVAPTSGVAQHVTIPGSLGDRDTIFDADKVMPGIPASIEAATWLVNNVTYKDYKKMGHDEWGGTDIGARIMTEGYAADKIAGDKRIMTTIKRGLVPNNRIHQFANEDFLGRNLILEELTMSIRRDAFLLEFFLYTTRALGIAHSNGLAIVDIT